MRNVIRRNSVVPAVVVAMTVLAMAESQGHAFSYYAEYMDNWTGCATTAATLSHSDNQIGMFVTAMDMNGQSRQAYFFNDSVWASDITDSSLGGQDQYQADKADIYALSSHGAAGVDGVGNQTFQTPMCHGGTLTNPTFDSNSAIWGGGTGVASSRKMRWAMLLTCFSADTNPARQWDAAMEFNQFEYVMGYRGTSADSSTTEEVGRDWVSGAIVNFSTFKSQWFSATSDWWVDDTAEVVSGGTSVADSDSRRDNLVKGTARKAEGVHWVTFSWSYQVG
jgi:Family of unknown function (DUF6345)